MSTNQIYANMYITTEYHPDDRLIYHTVHQPIGDDQIQILKDALNAGTKVIKQKGITKWLSDDRKNGPLPHDFLEWSLGDWCPRTVNAGWKYWAVVVPTEVVAAGALIPVIEKLHQLGLRMRVFTTVEDAKSWLDSME